MASEAHIFRLIDNAHASTADFSQNAIVGDCLADHEGPLAAMLGRAGAGVNHYVGNTLRGFSFTAGACGKSPAGYKKETGVSREEYAVMEKPSVQSNQS